MLRKSESGATGWIDPDDAPELTEEWFDHGVWEINGVPIDPPRPRETVDIRLRVDTNVAKFFRTSEPGWEGRVNEALRKALRQP